MRIPTLHGLVTALGATLAAAVVGVPALAQPAPGGPSPTVASVERRPPPAMFIAADPAKPDERVGPKSVDLQVRIVGRLAETRLTLTFGNPYARALAGDLYVPLPERATISGYALDVAGQLVDGVVVPKDEARRIFEKETRKGVDPGLVEWTKGNVFHTRVFPIPANGSRTIMVRWVAPLDEDANAAWLDLPLEFTSPVDAKLRVEIARGKEKPIVTGDGPLELAFDDRLVAEASLAKQALVQNLRIKLPDVGRRPVQLEKAADGRVWFAIQEVVPTPAAASSAPARVRIVWDASLSREKADRPRELALIDKLLSDRFAAAEVEVVILRNDVGPAKVFPPASGKAVAAYLKDVPCDGGTQLARLSPSALAAGGKPVDLQLVFTDGLSTFGDDDPGALGVPTWTLSSSLEAAHDALAHLAKDNGGAYFNLARASDAAVIAQVGRPVFSLLAARVVSGEVKDLLPGGTEPVAASGASFVAGRLVSDKATVQLAYGLPGQAASITKSYEVDAAQAVMGDLVSRAWAERKLSDLMASPQKNADDILALGKAHGIVTPGTSLLVLERLDQYVTYRVRPPASLPEMRKQWDAQIESEEVQRKATEQERLGEVADMWKAEVAWYEQTFTYPKNLRVAPEPSEEAGEGRAFGMGSGSASVSGHAEVSADIAAPSPEPREMRPDPRPANEDAKTKKADKDGGEDEAPPEPGVAMTPWDPQTPYIRALKRAGAGERVAVYLKQRAEFGTAPSFFLDVADFFVAQKDPAMALEVLSNIAELRLDDPALLRILGHRLEQLDRVALAVRTFEEVLRLRPEEPQSYRDLGLALARRAKLQTDPALARADYTRAMDLLAAIVKQRWDRFEQIELIALTELNRIWLDAKAAGVARFPLDDRFLKPMEMDLRIVMTWDADMTDMDLHVLEPSREEAYYSHNLTTIGGKVSKDFTQGYGPEVYAVKKAMGGTYKVKTKFYGSSAAELQGAVTLQVDVFTNWGRPNEKRRAMTLRLTDKKEDFLVGEIEF
ncbi:MAG: VIT domain-containing protein [Myxococcota bacterium]